MIKVFMLKQKLKIKSYGKRFGVVVMSAVVLLSAGIYGGFVKADQFDQQIQDLQQQNASNKQASDALAAQASSYQDAVDKLSSRINSIQQVIVATQKQSDELQKQIDINQLELDHQKQVLGINIKTMYLEGKISTLEILASSKDLSDFVDKEQYRNAVQSKVKASVDKITDLKQQLQQQQLQLQAYIKDQQAQQDQLAADESKQSQLLAYTEGQKAAYDQQTKANQSKIADLRRQQAIENARLFGSSGGQLGGGGYPWGYAKCIHTGQVEGWCDNYDWSVNGSIYNGQTGGYGYRNCTDWVSFRVRVAGGYVPSGLGDAKTWDDRAPTYGYTVSSTPREGAAAVSSVREYGHVMYVEAVNSDGSIFISDYNRAGTGKYDTSTLERVGQGQYRNPSNGAISTLDFVYF